MELFLVERRAFLYFKKNQGEFPVKLKIRYSISTVRVRVCVMPFQGPATPVIIKNIFYCLATIIAFAILFFSKNLNVRSLDHSVVVCKRRKKRHLTHIFTHAFSLKVKLVVNICINKIY